MFLNEEKYQAHKEEERVKAQAKKLISDELEDLVAYYAWYATQTEEERLREGTPNKWKHRPDLKPLYQLRANKAWAKALKGTK
ncbi:MAG: hypothetical protein ABSB32_16910 [Thermodesulfobacteriota bacterium]